MLLRLSASCLLGAIAALSSLAEGLSIVNSRFTHANGSKFIDLTSSTSFVNTGSETYRLEKVRLDPRTMKLDLTDTTFGAIVESSKMEDTRLDLTGTLFKFANGDKVCNLSGLSEVQVQVQVDNDALMEKYQFVYDFAPRMWLSELKNGWWPLDLQTFFDNMQGQRVGSKLY